jgi:hypothetical protein
MSVKVEGYWASHSDPSKDMYQSKYPWPVANSISWTGQKEFMINLAKIQSLGVEYSEYAPPEYRPSVRPRIVIEHQKGFASSRFELGVELNCHEYHDTLTGFRWTGDLLDYYIKRFNVHVSPEFYTYVKTFSF